MSEKSFYTRITSQIRGGKWLSYSVKHNRKRKVLTVFSLQCALYAGDIESVRRSFLSALMIYMMF